ncbi:MAG: hypothetical protein EBQ87_13495 [Planctomycetes bacterium]|nr:hypothetical protein [Planctomycetota bacterium]
MILEDFRRFVGNYLMNNIQKYLNNVGKIPRDHTEFNCHFEWPHFKDHEIFIHDSNKACTIRNIP